jgi:site-specific DNA-methyltransferase (adenine-specific)/modification methylase
MKPTWQTHDGRIQLYCGDCLKILPEIGKVDAVITDPPYGIGYVNGAVNIPYATKFAGKKVIGDNVPFNPTFLLKYKNLVTWGANHYCQFIPSDRGKWLVWDKRCQKIPTRDTSDLEMAWCSDNGRADRMFYHVWDGFIKGTEQGIKRIHPTQKPVALMEWCIKQVGNPAIVLDPFMGSGTTGIACIRTGLRFIGIEISPEYFEIAKKRIQIELQQQLLPLT